MRKLKLQHFLLKKIILLFLLTGCYTQKKAEKQLIKAQLNYPASVAQKTSQWYPCVEETKTDTVKVIEWRTRVDSVLRILKLQDTFINRTVYTCQDLPLLQSQLTTQKNIIFNLQKLLNEKPPVIVNTKLIKDSAGISVLRAEISTLAKGKEIYQRRYERSLLWLIFALIGFIASTFIKYTFKGKKLLK